ncbi:MAG TPA: hypothetical protein PLM53_10660 [Spirochaetota bacterium]|nr:hypothetical protein [Spirochaetota bacterium]HPC39313.1 hypothetical protein [Spirochaetota bacterium]HPL15120.1 hypothetical protein [Spirochaetota bacterium]HQF08749.1 hypothetical protein [Spirochaetota bacterium]HQH97550.1 hypothetical protein [Spirochaetota bacterium]
MMKRIRCGVALIAVVSVLTIDCNNSKSSLPPLVIPEIVFTTSGSSFAPVITVEGSPRILWTWDDGTTSDIAAPVKDYGSPAERKNRLMVIPWSAVTRINIGYDGGDGGSPSIEFVPDQHVTGVTGLRAVAPTLRQWCSSYNGISRLDFSNFIQIDTIECYCSNSLESVNLANTPALKRACFEDCNLHSLNLSGSPALEDLRAALNSYATIHFGSIGAHLRHVCVRDNPQITEKNLFADMGRFPNIKELYIWNDNQTGEFAITTPSAGGISILASGNNYTSANFKDALSGPSGYSFIDLSRNNLTSINIDGCSQVVNLNVSSNFLNQASVDYILHTLVELGRSTANVPSWITLEVNTGGSGNARPSADGLADAAVLEGRGWIVTVNP